MYFTINTLRQTLALNIDNNISKQTVTYINKNANCVVINIIADYFNLTFYVIARRQY
jgi:hypothetical protein